MLSHQNVFQPSAVFEVKQMKPTKRRFFFLYKAVDGLSLHVYLVFSVAF